MTRYQWERTCSGALMMNTAFMAAATTLARYSLGEGFAYVHMAEQVA